MKSPKNPQEAIRDLRDALHNLGLFVHPEGAILTEWALVCEWMDADGSFWLSAHTDSPSWRASGLMMHAVGQDLLQPLDSVGVYYESDNEEEENTQEGH